MAVKTQWTIRFSCGHVEVKDLAHKAADQRAGFAQWLADKQTCTPCWRAAHPPQRGDDWVEDKAEWLARQRAVDQQAADQWATRACMPVLVGSENASSWAVRVRYQLMRELHEWAVQEGQADESTYEWAEDVARTLDSATWWLDNRQHSDDEPTDPETLLELLTAAAERGEGIECENSY